MNKLVTTTLSLAACATLLSAESFDLGKISVSDDTAKSPLFEVAMDEEQIALHNKENIAEALDTISGVFLYTLGGRNDTLVSIRGFDSRRVGVYIDGMPIYVPYDGNFDYARFTTADVASIEVSKGYSSVIYGANTMGGVVNIITKKPTQPLEGKITLGTVYDNDFNKALNRASVNLGTRQGNLYAQLSASLTEKDHFRLSDDFTATAIQPEGDRLRSSSSDEKASAKVGYLFDDGSEIALGYSNQKGEKQQPPVTDTAYSKSKYWDWPKWDKESLYLIGQKKMENSYLKANAFYNYYNNGLESYDSISYTTQNTPKAWGSEYKDTNRGARVEYGYILPGNTIKAALSYKADTHKGYDIDTTTRAYTLAEKYEDHTISLGVEDTYKVTDTLRIMAGIGMDTIYADSLYDANEVSMDQPDDKSAVSPQIAAVYRLDTASDVRVSMAQKTHLPTMKERYSQAFGDQIINPDLDAEKATHYEVAYHYRDTNLAVGTAVYYTVVNDLIQSVDLNSTLAQNQNVGDMEHRGFELDVTWYADSLELGGNYSYIEVEDKNDDGIKALNVPRNQLFAYAKYELFKGLSTYLNANYREGAYSKDLNGDYLAVPSFTTYSLKLSYAAGMGVSGEVGVKNLTDEDYYYDLGFPEAGREYFANLSYKF